MSKRYLLFVGLILCNWLGYTQTMEEKVNSYIENFLSESKYFISKSELSGTQWWASDAMGSRTLAFNENDKYKLRNRGCFGTWYKQNGCWYIFNEFIVLEKNKDKTPLYVLMNGESVVLVDDDQLDVLKLLLTDVSYKDGELKPYTYEEIFTFLNGFTLTD